MNTLRTLDIVLTVYNQEKVINRVLYGIFFHTTTPFNLILVFDGCTDRSEEKASVFIRKFRPQNLRRVIVKHTQNIFETRANNIGFKQITQDYVIAVQDDMVIREMGWERRLTYPLRLFDDIVAVTAEEARDVKIMNRQQENFYNRASRELGTLPRNTFAIRDIINRGPVAFRVDYLKRLHYFDEKFSPCEYDDADLSLRAWLRFGWKVGAFWIDYQSKAEWSKSLAADSTMGSFESRKKNRAIINDRYHKYFSQHERHTKDIAIEDKDIDYIAHPVMPSFVKRLISYCTSHDVHDVWNLLVHHVTR